MCQTRLYHLTTALHEKQFTTIGLNQTLTRFTEQKANRFSINHYDHAIARPNEDIFSNDDTNANPQITKKLFIKSSYVFNVDESRPLIVPHKNIQPVGIPILEYIPNIKFKHKFYNLIQNTPHSFSPSSEEHKIIKAL